MIGILAPHSLKLRRGNEGICEARVGMSANQGQSVENVASKMENGEGFEDLLRVGWRGRCRKLIQGAKFLLEVLDKGFRGQGLTGYALY